MSLTSSRAKREQGAGQIEADPARALGSAVPRRSPARGRGAAPAPEGPREGTCVGVVEQRSDPAHLHRRVFEHLPGYLEAALVHEFLEAGAEGIQPAIQRATVDREEGRDLVCLGAIGHERGAQHASHLLREVIAKVLAAGPGHAMRYQAVPSRVGNLIVGVVEKFEIEPGLRLDNPRQQTDIGPGSPSWVACSPLRRLFSVR